jgi:hypothetical protein
MVERRNQQKQRNEKPYAKLVDRILDGQEKLCGRVEMQVIRVYWKFERVAQKDYGNGLNQKE